MQNLETLYLPTLEKECGLPAVTYLSDAVFEAESIKLFHSSWLCIGRTGDAPNSGDISPLTFAGVPLLLIRDREAVLRVFHNVCPHRGAQLADEPKNCRANLVCPYHSWAFNLKGGSVRMPHVGGAGVNRYAGIDPCNIHLSEVRSAAWNGLLFVNLAGDAPPFEDFIAPVQDRIGALDPDTVRYDDNLSAHMAFKANWKLVVENFVESYHVPAVHAELERVNPMRAHYQILGGFSYLGQGSTAYEAAEDVMLSGLPHRKDLGTATAYEALYIYPNLIFGPLANFGFIIITDPQSPSLTHERLEFFFYGDEAMAREYDELRKANADFLQLVNSQDLAICEKVQKGRSSPAFNGGVFALPQEATTLHFLKLVAAKMLASGRIPAETLVTLGTEDIYHDKAR